MNDSQQIAAAGILEYDDRVKPGFVTARLSQGGGARVAVYAIDPLVDQRWSEFVDRNSHSSIFHCVGWLEALWRTYGCKPLVFTTSGPNEPLANGLVSCEVRSWITGKRLVSLPFSDHCDVLADSAASCTDLLDQVANRVGREFKYAEIRPTSSLFAPRDGNWRPSVQFIHHRLTLEPSIDELYRNLHKNCIQRKIRRAEKEALRYSKGRSDILLQQFYDLLLRTRRRQRIPPQPLNWYRNLISSMGDRLMIRVVSKDAVPAAAILTLSHKGTTTYKYGCSDERLNRYGGMPFLFWMAIQEARGEGVRELDLGRSEAANSGLVRFKDRLGAAQEPMTYWVCSHERATEPRSLWIAHLARHIAPHLPAAFLHLPRAILAASGEIFYKHMD
jgi:hypothetical protein